MSVIMMFRIDVVAPLMLLLYPLAGFIFTGNGNEESVGQNGNIADRIRIIGARPSPDFSSPPDSGFLRFHSGTNVIKLFTAVIYGFS
jgi:hypothetical protein